MLNELIDAFYSKLALSFHRNEANYQKKNELSTLSDTDTSTLEIVYLLNRPTYKELTDFLKISTPNATYRINKLIEKGYLRREQDPTDKRRYFLNVTDKFMDYYCINDHFMELVAQRAKDRFTDEELQQFERMFRIMIEELMD